MEFCHWMKIQFWLRKRTTCSEKRKILRYITATELKYDLHPMTPQYAPVNWEDFDPCRLLLPIDSDRDQISTNPSTGDCHFVHRTNRCVRLEWHTSRVWIASWASHDQMRSLLHKSLELVTTLWKLRCLILYLFVSRGYQWL